MLPTFVIGLREGLEAALIVGIVAAFLRQRDRRDLLRWVWIGVASAAALCLAGGIALRLFSQNLPQRQQEGLETVIGSIAIVMVTYMVVWMRRNARSLKGQLEGAAAEALAAGSGWALVAMAFLAVLREGFETSVFLLAAYNESDNGTVASIGAGLGLAVAVGIGYGIYRGGVKLNLSRFFRATGVLLVLIAAGLVASALHTAHEAAWLNIGQHQLLDLSSLVQPGTVQESLLTGMLGIQARPVTIEVIGWLVYLIPVALYVGWPPGKSLARRTVLRLSAGFAAVTAITAVLLAVLAPSVGDLTAQTSANAATLSAPDSASSAFTATVTTGSTTRSLTGTATRGTATSHNGLTGVTYTADVPAQVPSDRAAELTYAQIAALNGGSLPFGVRAKEGTIPVTYKDTAVATLWVEPSTGQVFDVAVVQKQVITATFSVGVVLLNPAKNTQAAWPDAVSGAQVAELRTAISDSDTRRTMHAWATAFAVVAGLALLVGAAYLFRGRGARPTATEGVTKRKAELARS